MAGSSVRSALKLLSQDLSPDLTASPCRGRCDRCWGGDHPPGGWGVGVHASTGRRADVATVLHVLETYGSVLEAAHGGIF